MMIDARHHPRRSSPLLLLLATALVPNVLCAFQILPSGSPLPYSSTMNKRQFYRGTIQFPRSYPRDRARGDNSRRVLPLFVEQPNPRLLGRKQGVYTRPSAAIERGSGFFVPGLEGPRVRLLFGSVLIVLTALNHELSLGLDSGYGNTFLEGLAVVYALLILLQGAVEFRKEGLQQGVLRNGSSGEKRAGIVVSYQQLWSIPVDDVQWRERLEWAASTYLALTAATHMMLVGPGKVVYFLGTTAPIAHEASQAAGCQAALDTLAQSKSGRVSLPPHHPAVTSLANQNHNRCVVLQRVNTQLCWILTSDQLLAGFTKNDLLWLGQLARYVDPDSFS